MSYHFVLQVSQTLSLHSKSLPCKGATDPNKPPRKAALFWTLLPQLFVQFEAQFAAEPLSLLNAHSEDTTQQPRPTNSYRNTDTAIHPIPDLWSGISVCPAAHCAAGVRPDINVRHWGTRSPKPLCAFTHCVSRDFVPRPFSLHQNAAFAAATDPNKPPRKAALPWTLLPQRFVQSEAQLAAEPRA